MMPASPAPAPAPVKVEKTKVPSAVKETNAMSTAMAVTVAAAGFIVVLMNPTGNGLLPDLSGGLFSKEWTKDAAAEDVATPSPPAPKTPVEPPKEDLLARLPPLTAPAPKAVETKPTPAPKAVETKPAPAPKAIETKQIGRAHV